MTTGANDSPPLACAPGVIPDAERPAHFALIRTLFAEAAEARESLPDGYAFRFPADALEPLGRFFLNERKCCPFLAFSLEVSPARGPVWLRITGPEGTRELLDAELPL